MTKPKHADITYRTVSGKQFTETVELPLARGRGEALLNEAELNGCTNIDALRKRVAELY